MDVFGGPSSPGSEYATRPKNDDFEALIDLLATDDDGETLGAPFVRKVNGELDLEKLRTMLSPRLSVGNTSTSRTGTPHSVNELLKPAAVPRPIQSYASPLEVEAESSHLHDNRTRNITTSEPGGPRPADTFIHNHHPPPVTSGKTAKPSETVQARQLPLPSQVHRPATTSATHAPLDFAQLTEALASAKVEIHHLRRRYEELRSMLPEDLLNDIETRLGHAVEDHTESTAVPGSPTVRVVHGIQASAPIAPKEIQSLSGDDAKRILSNIVSSLGLPQTGVSRTNTSSAHSASVSRPRDFADVQRAVEFATQVDELVWRRSTVPPGPGGPTAPVFDAENFDSVMDRLRLWERLVRRPRC